MAAPGGVRYYPGNSDDEGEDVFPGTTTDDGEVGQSVAGHARDASDADGAGAAAAGDGDGAGGDGRSKVSLVGASGGGKQKGRSWFRRKPRSGTATPASDSDADAATDQGGFGRGALSWAGKRVPKGGLQRSMERYRERNMEKFQQTIQEWLPRELEAFRAPPSSAETTCRVMVIRHGMGKHNDLKGAFSYANRDAELNEVGEEQAKMVGNVLHSNGVLDQVDLVVVSPFRRTIQTANHVLGKSARDLRTYVQPLCAEHTFNWSAIQQGDRGSTPKELSEQFPHDEHPQYRRFEDVDAYCREVGVARDGAWWHHGGAGTSETQAQFRERATKFKKWLGAYCVREKLKNVVVVSHGGLLSIAFGFPKLHNCEIRVFDLTADGRFARVASVLEGGAPGVGGVDGGSGSGAGGGGGARVLEIYTIHTSRAQGHKLYHLTGVLRQEPFARLWRLSDIRSMLNDALRAPLTAAAFISRLGAPEYAANATVQGVIHGFPKTSVGAVAKLRAWFYHLNTLLGAAWCPPEVADRARYFFTGEAMHRGSALPGTGVIKMGGDDAAAAGYDADAAPSSPGLQPESDHKSDTESDDDELMAKLALCSDDDDDDDDDGEGGGGGGGSLASSGASSPLGKPGSRSPARRGSGGGA